MKNAWMFISLVFVFSGCAIGKEKLEMYTNNPEFIIKDPHFYDYQQNLDAVEKDYLSKKITYADYLKKKEELDSHYNQDVQRRERIINDTP